MKHMILALLDAGPAYGLELKQHYDELVGVVAGTVNVGQIYATLGRLEGKGFVAHDVEVSSVGPDRKVYSLTEVGAKELQRWFESSSSPIEMKSEAISRIVVAIRMGRPELQSLVRSHRGQCLETLRALDLAATNPERSIQALVQATALHVQADLRWLDYVESVVGPHEAATVADPTRADGTPRS